MKMDFQKGPELLHWQLNKECQFHCLSMQNLSPLSPIRTSEQ